MNILGFDPGVTNMAYSVVTLLSAKRFRLKRVGMFPHPIKELKGDVKKHALHFQREVRKIIRQEKIDLIAAERFQARGLRGNTGELVATMQGILAVQKPKCVLITASQWKNCIQKHIDLKEVYKEIDVKPHELDAVCIAVYSGSKQLQQTPFAFLSKRRNVRKFTSLVEKRAI